MSDAVYGACYMNTSEVDGLCIVYGCGRMRAVKSGQEEVCLCKDPLLAMKRDGDTTNG